MYEILYITYDVLYITFIYNGFYMKHDRIFLAESRLERFSLPREFDRLQLRTFRTDRDLTNRESRLKKRACCTS